jgi:predicted RNase H-like HicB family nuclease
MAPQQPEQLNVIFSRVTNGAWIAEVESIPGTVAYGATRTEAMRGVLALAL